MFNPFHEINWQPGLTERRSFGRSIAIGLPAIAAVLLLIGHWRTGEWKTGPLWLAGAGVALGSLCWAVPQIAKPFYFLIYGVGCCIGIIVSNALLAAIFYGVITPIGLLLRLVGKDPLTRKLDPTAKSYWLDAERTPDAARYFRQF